jgi:hypothetical protein
MAEISILRRTVIGALAFAVCFAVLAPIAFWKFQQASERGKAKKELATELRLLAADLQTGININDFLQQVARVRAAYAGAKAYLTPEQTGKFAQIDLALDGINFFWDWGIKYQDIVDPKSEANRRGLANLVDWEIVKTGECGFDARSCAKQLMDKTGQSISSFLEEISKH